ncbi:polyprenyl synthetase family protein [candidate division KSB1 bacterium]|nr:polyprenyl synthetase family protein [candidate division KSB1 bacterium]MBL7103680.1 polyprenyl synthetase family protein [Bacteroidales bacterium]
MNTIKKIQSKIEEHFSKINFDKNPTELYAPIAYTLNQGGKRLRPALCLMACDMFGGDIDKAINPAIGIEIFHNFTLVHDDIMDNAPIRRGKVTVCKKWNTNIAILSGDTMMTIAYDYIMKAPVAVRSDVFAIFNKTAIEVCEGQQYDMNFETQQNVSINDYIEMIRLKTAVLLAGSLKIGAIIGGADETDAEKIYRFGVNIGLSFQLKDDLLDVFSDEEKFGKKNGGDIVTNKKTYLYLKAFELAKGRTFDSLWYYFNKYFKDDSVKINGVKEIYEELKIKELTQQAMDKYYRQALKYLEKIKVNESLKSELKKFVEKLMLRES